MSSLCIASNLEKPALLGATPDAHRPLTNFWGYNPVGHFTLRAPHRLSPEEGSHILDFREMVKALYKAGIEVILEMVFTHTDKGNHQGPTISFKGLNNCISYYLDPHDKQ